jgi:hypothetical protein
VVSYTEAVEEDTSIEVVEEDTIGTDGSEFELGAQMK